MLILTRTIGQQIRIGPDIKVIVVSVKGDRVRLGIDAPSGVPVNREEIAVEMEQEDEAKEGGRSLADRKKSKKDT